MITLYTLQSCYHCQQAKRKLKELNIPYDEIDVNQETADYLKTRTDQMSLPVIFFNDEVVELDEAISRFDNDI